MRVIGTVVGFVVVVLGLTWVVQGNDFFLYRYFGPQYANVQREIFEQTAPYNQGMAQDLRRMQEEYLAADADHKPALAEVILHNYASYDLNKLPADLRDFYAQVKRDHGLASVK
ncbi:MAG TPA: hypothetical protein VMU27_01400 [Candidatus Paceibacterota bacterium]|nr:hypothetical protein [Candidatus Paceibacterota bacterium]